MKEPVLSIIIPAYNEEKYIVATIKSLKNQIYKDYEIIVIDNNSTDKTQKIARKYVKKVFFEKKKGYHNAVNRGVKEAKGEIITFCDADTIYPRNWTATIKKELQKSIEIVAVYGPMRIRSESTMTNLYVGPMLLFWILSRHIFQLDISCGFNFAFKKKAYLKVGGYNPEIYDQIGGDWELGRRLRNIGKIKFIPELFVQTSCRRPKINWFLISMKGWWYLSRRKTPKMSYEEYNIEYR